MSEFNFDEGFGISEAAHSKTRSGMIIISKKKSVMCFRKSCCTGQSKRKCKGYIGKDKKQKCECECHE